MSAAALPESPRPHRRTWIITAAVVLLLGVALTWEVIATRPVRRAVITYTALIGAANRQDLDAVRRLCTRRYLEVHSPQPAREGGVTGLPRNIHTNFQAWRHGPNVWLCPTNRVGPLYQFVLEAGTWRFDGPVGILRPRGQVVPIADLPGGDDMPVGDDEPPAPSP